MSLIDIHSPPRPRFVQGHLYVRSPEPVEFPASEPDEEKVSESKRHLENRTALYLVLKRAFAATCSIGCDQFVYWNPSSARQCLSPDGFVKLGIPDASFRVWKTWEHGAPDLGVEIVSKSDERADDWEEKLARYRAAGIREIVRFDPDDTQHPIRVWDRVADDVVERAPEDPDLLVCHTLALWWTVAVDPLFGRMLRLARDREGTDLLATPDEASVRAETQRDAMAAEIERLKAELTRARRGG